MRRITALLASLVLILALAPVTALAVPTSQLDTSGERIAGSWIVTLRAGVDSSAHAPALARQAGGRVGYVYEHALNGFSFKGSDDAAAALLRSPLVARVEDDGAVGLVAEQKNAVWGLDRLDERELVLDGTYTYAYDGTGVTAYVIDTGIRISHNEFAVGRATYGYDSIDSDMTSDDCHGHGTHVAGTVGGATYGVAKNVKLVAVRVLDCNGSGTWSGVIAGIDWVTANAKKPAVANMSLGGSANSSVDDAVEKSIASGVSYAVAAGNGNIVGIAQDACKYSPARAPNAMTIGATDATDTKASWSNYGDCVDWFAPGVSIESAWRTSDTATRTASGTSMASPHTAGVAALYLDAKPDATPAEVREGLYTATTKGIVKSSKTANNHLLFSRFDLDGGTGDEPNTPPTADANGPYADNEDASITFSAAGSTDSDDDPLTYTWEFGDGSSTTSTTESVTHAYAWGGTFTVTLTVSDGRGGTDSDTATATVDEVNDAPTADPGGPYSGVVGSAITFDGSGSSDPDNEDGTPANDQTLAYTWDFGDDTPATSGETVTHTYATAGTYVATLTVSDGIASDSATTDVTVSETATTMHVGDLDGNSQSSGGPMWTAGVTITVHDAAENPIAGATVSGTFSYNGSSFGTSCETGSAGTCSVSSPEIHKRYGSMVFTVDSVTGGSLTYDSNDNHDPDGDSDGTTISVAKPA